MRGAERRETRSVCDHAPERLAKPPDTLVRRVLPACDRGKAPLGAPLGGVFCPRRPCFRAGERGRFQALPLSGPLPLPIFARRVQPNQGQPVVIPADGWSGASRYCGYKPQQRAPRSAPSSVCLRKTPLDGRDGCRNIISRNFVKRRWKHFGRGVSRLARRSFEERRREAYPPLRNRSGLSAKNWWITLRKSAPWAHHPRRRVADQPGKGHEAWPQIQPTCPHKRQHLSAERQ